jgi:preprotein translocase subunit SecD
MKRSALIQMVIMVVFTMSALIAVIVTDTKPVLGLDLQGGISVVLEPFVDGKPAENVKDEQVEQAIAIIRNRIDALGVSEPEISSQGNSILVQLPGIDDQERALELVGRTAKLEFRPVLSSSPMVAPDPKREATLRKELNIPEGTTAEDIAKEEDAAQAALAPTDPNATIDPTATVDPSVLVDPEATSNAPVTPAPTTGAPAQGFGGAHRSPFVPAQETPTTKAADKAPPTTKAADKAPPTTKAADKAPPTTTPKPLNKEGVNVYDPRFAELYQLEKADTTQFTDPDALGGKAKENVTLPDKDGEQQYELGPQLLTGSALSGASAGLDNQGQWQVGPSFKGGKNGIDLFNKAATLCYNGDPLCPPNSQDSDTGASRGQLAIVLDGKVLTAPSINEAEFNKDQISISGSFAEQEAKDVATALRYGALPLELRPSTTQTVTATLGQGALRAVIIAGLVGLGIVALYFIAYYRLLGIVAFISLALSGSLLWIIISLLGATLTLAGLVGIVVSIGVSLDSNVVFYEHLKEDVLNGKSLRSSGEKSFPAAFSTIVKADVSSLIGAAVLYFLTAGSVRGFAFYLGLSVLLDLVASYFFMRPAVAFLTRSKLGGKRSLFGIPVLYTPAELADQRGPGLPYIPEVEPSADLATTGGGKP